MRTKLEFDTIDARKEKDEERSTKRETRAELSSKLNRNIQINEDGEEMYGNKEKWCQDLQGMRMIVTVNVRRL